MKIIIIVSEWNRDKSSLIKFSLQLFHMSLHRTKIDNYPFHVILKLWKQIQKKKKLENQQDERLSIGGRDVAVLASRRDAQHLSRSHLGRIVFLSLSSNVRRIVSLEDATEIFYPKALNFERVVRFCFELRTNGGRVRFFYCLFLFNVIR